MTSDSPLQVGWPRAADLPLPRGRAVPKLAGFGAAPSTTMGGCAGGGGAPQPLGATPSEAGGIVTVGAEGLTEGRRLGPGAVRTISGETAGRLSCEASAQSAAGRARVTVRPSERGGVLLLRGAPGNRGRGAP